MFTRAFWKQTAERAIKTGAQFCVAGIGGNMVSAWSLDWKQIAGFGVTGLVLSVFTSLGSEPFGPEANPSVVN